MCGRYAFFDLEEVYETRKILEDIAETFGPEKAASVKTGEVFPSETAAVLLQTGEKPRAEAVRWGYALPGQKNLVINAKSETLLVKPLFMKSAAHKKCLVPAHAFYEWQALEGKKIKHTISVKGRPMFYLCGLYADFMLNGQREKRFVIITQDAGVHMQGIHPRMPLIPPEDLARQWLAETVNIAPLIQEISQRKPELLITAV